MTKKEKLLTNKPLFYLLSFTWGILTTLIGLLALLAVITFTNKKQKIVKVVAGRIVVCLPHANFGGISMGIVLIVSEFYPPLVKHELGHTIQNMLFGPLFIFIVGIPSGIRYHFFDQLSRRHYRKYGTNLLYDAAWFEGQATSLGNKYFKDSELQKLTTFQ